MTSTGFQASPFWSFPSNIGTSPMPGTFHDPLEPEETHAEQPKPESPPQSYPHAKRRSSRKYWPPRTCRICLETINPTFHPPSENLPGMLQPAPSVTYDSSDSEAGRLLRPCKCKGSSKYVHEGCLQAWRHADPGYGKRNYWQCPTCSFRYRLERMAWSRWISSTATQIVLTVTIFVAALFMMGFVADPIINLYTDPYSVLTAPTTVTSKIEPILTDDDVPSWAEHFIKGLAATGLLGFVKVLLAWGPWHYWNVRGSGIMGGHRSGNNGRDRMANISWIVVVIGVVTFLVAVYKGVRSWSRRTLEKASERVMDVAGDDEDEEDDEPPRNTAESS